MIDLTYYANNDIESLQEAYEKHITSLAYIGHIRDRIEVQIIKHLAKEEYTTIEGVKYLSFLSNNRLFHIPSKTHAYIRAYNPDIVLVQGLGHPWQVMALRKALGKKAIIMVQHHGEMPHSRMKMALQKLTDRLINAYLFTAKGNAIPWIKKSIIRSMDKCHEVIEATTNLRRQNKTISRLKLGINQGPVFLSVANLDNNKDPMVKLEAFGRYLKEAPNAEYYMIYAEDILLPQIKAILGADTGLKKAVHLIGKVQHGELAYWFSAADFYISASHKEACGYALLEAMACGCIPIVSNIPPYSKLTKEGEYGLLWEKGNADSLYSQLISTQSVNIEKFSAQISAYALKAHSAEAIANDIYEVCIKLQEVNGHYKP
jgi:glycosyltransferase involved in cell wall biosynthesis